MGDNRRSAKILVLGDSGVGKSSLIHLICHSSVLTSAHWTIGCSIEVKLHDNHFLEFWDVGGSRNHKIARSFLYQDYHGIMLVYDATNNKSKLNLSEWLYEVMQKSGDRDLDSFLNNSIPIITVATKKDLSATTLSHSMVTHNNGVSYETSDNQQIGFDDNRHCSVVNFNNVSPDTSYPFRRHLMSSQYSIAPTTTSTTAPLLQPTNSSLLLSSLMSTASGASAAAAADKCQLLLQDQVVFVNTQDALSFQHSSKNNQMLNNFFKHVVRRRGIL